MRGDSMEHGPRCMLPWAEGLRLPLSIYWLMM